MTKAAVKTVLVTLPLLVTLLAGYLAFVKIRQNSLLDNGAAFSLTIAENIISTWNTDYFQQVADPALLAMFDRGGIDAMFRNFTRMGTLVALGDARGELVNASWLPSETPVTGRYYIPAEFSGGPAEVYVELVKAGDSWMLGNFYIQAPQLTE